MKKTVKFLVSLMLGLLIISSIAWYLFSYDRAFTRDTLLNQARYQDMNGNSRLSSFFYDAAYRFSGLDENVAIELANQYKQDGNYTKAEYTLTEAIRSAPTEELYTALSRAYVEQDKLLDAVKLLDSVSQPDIKAQLDAQRPSTPVSNPESGYYSEYIQVALDSKCKYIFYTLDESYPSIDGEVYQTPIELPAGETIVTAIAVGEDGLVSPVATFQYTITGVIEEVTLEDAAMNRAIRELIGVGEQDLILSNQLWNITEFTVPSDAASYDDLVYLPNLTHLTIDSKTLDDMQFLSSLQKLTNLNLSGCRLDTEKMAVVATLPALNELNLANCGLSTVDFLENSPSLKVLDVNNNTLRKLDVLSTIPTLETLNLEHNAVVSLEHVGTLANLKELNIGYNSVTSLVPLANCTKLVRLNADHNGLENLEGLHGMAQLAYLSVDYNTIYGVSVLTANTGLVDLSIASNKITDIASLSALSKLEILDFSGNQVEYLPQFAADSPLQTIDGSYNMLSSIDSLSSLQSLTHVYMDYNLITDINALENCFCLVQINVYGNAIPDVSLLRDRDIIVNYDPTLAQAAEESE